MWADNARLVDVSHWNPEDDTRLPHGEMDWEAAVAGGLVGAIIKYSQGSSATDPAAFLHAWRAYQANVPLLGGYHFGDGSDPERQAAHFLDCMHGDYGADLDGRLLMLDAERNSPQMTVAQAEIFVQAIHDAIGRWPWLYMGRYGPTGDGAGLPSRILSSCPLLIPAYGNHAANLGSILPAGWRLPRDGADRGEPGVGVVRGWQFTDGTVNGGPFPGLGRVDQSRLIGLASLEEATKAWAG